MRENHSNNLVVSAYCVCGICTYTNIDIQITRKYTEWPDETIVDITFSFRVSNIYLVFGVYIANSITRVLRVRGSRKTHTHTLMRCM